MTDPAKIPLVRNEVTSYDFNISRPILVKNILDKVGDGVVTATSFVGSGASLTGIDATSLKDGGGTIRVQANTSGAVVTGIVTATAFVGDGSGLIWC